MASELFELTHQALLLILILSAPPVLISTGCGIAVAIFQAATQIQEQTLSFLIKLSAVILTLLFFGAQISEQICRFATHIFLNFHLWV